MKNIYKFSLFTAIAALTLQSCYDEKMEWYNPHTAITSSEIPILTSTKIKNCDSLITYLGDTDMKLGIGVIGTSYIENQDYANIVNGNFNSIEPTTEFALCNIITDSKGTYSFDSPDALYNAAKQNNMHIFGHSLISDQFQNVSYLNAQIEDDVTASSSKNYINVKNENEYNFSYSIKPEDYQRYEGYVNEEDGHSGWNTWDIHNDEYSNIGVNTLDINTTNGYVTTANEKNCLSAEMQDEPLDDGFCAEVASDYIPVPNGSKMDLSFYVKAKSNIGGANATVKGNMKLHMTGVKSGTNMYPTSGGQSNSTSISLSSEWKQVVFKGIYVDGSLDAPYNVKAAKIFFDLTEAVGLTVYFDEIHFTLAEGSTTTTGTNYIANSYFDGNEGTYNWSITNNRAGGTMKLGVAKNGQDNSPSGSNCLQVYSPETFNSASDFTINAKFADAKTLVQGKRYTLTFYARAADDDAIIEFSTSDKAGSVTPTNSQAPEEGKQSFHLSTSWEKQVWEFTALTSDIGSMNFKFAKNVYGKSIATTFYLDNVTLTSTETSTGAKQKTTRTSNYVSSKDDNMIKASLEGVMKTYIDSLMHRYSDIDAWDVVQHAVSDSPTIGTAYLSSNGATAGNGVFYWGDYMQDDFIFDAFKYARAANKNAKLFLSESGLVHNETKQSVLQQYISKLQAYGGKNYIDGLSLELHLTCSTDVHIQAELLNQVTELFTNLNNQYCTSSSFLIRIGELDVAIESDYLPSTAQLAAQAEMYEHAINCYRTLINTRNQYGIYLWKLTDAETETDHYKTIFDADLQRKHAYLGVCNGLYGSDVSEIK